MSSSISSPASRAWSFPIRSVYHSTWVASDHPPVGVSGTAPPSIAGAVGYGFYFSRATASAVRCMSHPRSDAPAISRFVAGDMVAIEPDTVDPEVGGTRIEDLIVVIEDAAQPLTNAFPLRAYPISSDAASKQPRRAEPVPSANGKR